MELTNMQIYRRHNSRSKSMGSKNPNQEESMEEGRILGSRRLRHRLPSISNSVRRSPQRQPQTNTSGDVSGDSQSRVTDILAELGKKESKIQSWVENCFVQKGRERRSHRALDTEISSDTEISHRANSLQSNTNINTPRLRRFLIEGDLEGFKEETSAITQLNQIKLGDGNTVLHIAASAGHENLIHFILTKSSDLIKSKNSEQDIALHVAAKAGQLEACMSLFNWELQEETASENGREENGSTSCPISREEKQATITEAILKEVDKNSNTLLHIVLESQQILLAFYLFDKFPPASTMVNRQGISPIYLAIKGEYWDLVEHMLEKGQRHHVRGLLRKGQSIMHAVIMARHKEILDIILEIHRDPIEAFDQQGDTPLSYAASIGFLEGFKSLLKHNQDSAFRENKDGSFPIHKAAGGGHIEVVMEFFSQFGYIGGLLTRQGKNILHMASGNGKHKMVSFLLQTQKPGMESLINNKDYEGNTPLHLAAIGGYFKVVYTLMKDKRAKFALRNRKGLTAFDASEKYDGSLPSFEQHLMWLALRSACVPQSPKPHNTIIAATNGAANQGGKYKKSMAQHQSSWLEKIYEKKAQTLSLVAILVATVTFAAGLAVAGGYNDSDPHRGLATLVNKSGFQAFVICNIIAMHTSILAVITFIWGQLGDAHFINRSFALLMLGVSLTSMSAAFMVGASLLFSILPWLAFVVFIVGSVSLVALLVYSFPLYYYLRLKLMLFLNKKMQVTEAVLNDGLTLAEM